MTSRRAIEQNVYDDACDLGQCCMDPCYFFYMKTKKFLEIVRSSKVDPSEEQAKHQKAVFIFAMQQTAYFVMMGGGWAITFLCTFPLVDGSELVSKWRKHETMCLFLACVFSWLLAALTPPGSITQETVGKFDNYRYDGVLYQQHAMCPTMPTVRRPARSKFDRYSSQQVPRFDHYCGWLGQSIGEENYRFFLFFLLVHTIMLIYGTSFTFVLIKEAAEVALSASGDGSAPTALNVLSSALKVHPWVVLKLILMSIALPFLVALSSFHVLLVRKGMTTNEHFKWKALLADGKQYVELDSYDGDCLDFAPFESSWKSIDDARQFYNLGFIENFYEVLHPRSLRGGKKNI